MMLRWLADRHADAALGEAAGRIQVAVETVLAERIAVQPEPGGDARRTQISEAVCRAMG